MKAYKAIDPESGYDVLVLQREDKDGVIVYEFLNRLNIHCGYDPVQDLIFVNMTPTSGTPVESGDLIFVDPYYRKRRVTSVYSFGTKEEITELLNSYRSTLIYEEHNINL